MDCTTPADTKGVPHRVFNLGNNKTETLLDFITTLEQQLAVSAEKEFLPMQPGDVPDTWADITHTTAALGYQPTTTIQTGLARFVAWYVDYYGVQPMRRAA